MEDVFVARLMSTDLVTVDDDATVATAAQRMLEEGVSSILVVDEDRRLAGLLTATDFVRLVRENDPEDETPVAACMTVDVVTADPQDTLDDLAELTEHGYTHLPVTTDDNEVVGMVSTTDVTAYLVDR
ncbi:CBS domain-containing protein [Halorubrum sp. JWXQ-INN 858]|uniref:CBS domain-containing protein n=1 Tax=Halorubrum sp. JWXQ-INN 858 TaxID=2690782 RepID=UPI0013579C4A|nr:CBS domain-containing protein [Halorubrum sp. JWXQ-INN 858]MWV65055.1 CBS domain-containing protein [Halorubrum sp. JWXQ-INN 858]